MSEELNIRSDREKKSKKSKTTNTLDIDFARFEKEPQKLNVKNLDSNTSNLESTDNGVVEVIHEKALANGAPVHAPAHDKGKKDKKVQYYSAHSQRAQQVSPPIETSQSLSSTSGDSEPQAESSTAIEVELEGTPGERLRAAREARNISQADIAKWLKLDVRLIDALEKGDDSIMPETVFKVGYLRNYAKLVDVSPETVIGKQQSYSKSNRFTPTNTTSNPDVISEFLNKLTKYFPRHFVSNFRDNDLKRGTFLAISIISFIAIAWVTASLLRSNDESGAEQNLPQKIKQEKIDKGEQAIHSTSLAISAEDKSSSLGESPNSTKGDTGNKNSDDLQTANVDQSAGLQQGAVSEYPLSIGTKPVVANLVIHFTADSWIDIRDASGKRLIRSLGQAGVSKEVSGVAPFQVLIGYAPGVTIKYNGQSYDFSKYKSKRVARFTIDPPSDVN